jgi:tRNA dimethylallyltransferase
MATILVVVGATSTGKSAVALAAAERLGGEILNADALQVVRELDIGTAKPTREERARVPHHLLDLIPPTARFSAGEWARRARAVLCDLAARGRPAIVVGGSGLYLRALFSGLAEIPEIPESLRAGLAEELRRDGLAALRARLAQVDPETAARLAPGDRQRTMRALEVARATGRPLSDWIRRRSASTGSPRATWLGLTLPRPLLYDRIEARVLDMIDRGWLEEVRRLLAAGVPRDAPGLQAIGYSDWIRHLDGEADQEETVARIVRATRRYAKRQETWFRGQADVEWLDARDPERLLESVMRRVAA